MHQEKQLWCVNEMWGYTESPSDGLVQLEQLFHGCLGEELLQIVAFTFSYFGFWFREKEYLALLFISLISAPLLSSFHVCLMADKEICSSVRE